MTRRYWHKRIVRAGPNTLQPYRKNPPDREIAADDIVFCDFGPIFEQWEADFGRTFVLGQDPVKRRLRDALPVIFDAGREYFEQHQDVTGEQLYAHMVSLAREAGRMSLVASLITSSRGSPGTRGRTGTGRAAIPGRPRLPRVQPRRPGPARLRRRPQAVRLGERRLSGPSSHPATPGRFFEFTVDRYSPYAGCNDPQ